MNLNLTTNPSRGILAGATGPIAPSLGSSTATLGAGAPPASARDVFVIGGRSPGSTTGLLSGLARPVAKGVSTSAGGMGSAGLMGLQKDAQEASSSGLKGSGVAFSKHKTSMAILDNMV
jgi:hypothetical protein